MDRRQVAASGNAKLHVAHRGSEALSDCKNAKSLVVLAAFAMSVCACSFARYHASADGISATELPTNKNVLREAVESSKR